MFNTLHSNQQCKLLAQSILNEPRLPSWWERLKWRLDIGLSPLERTLAAEFLVEYAKQQQMARDLLALKNPNNVFGKVFTFLGIDLSRVLHFAYVYEVFTKKHQIKLYAFHLMDNHVYRSQDLSGSCSSATSKHLMACIQTYLNQSYNSNAVEGATDLSRSIDILNTYHQIALFKEVIMAYAHYSSNSSERKKALATHCLRLAQDLKDGDTLLIPSGFMFRQKIGGRTIQGGHAVCYSVVKRKKGYRITLFNTGAGSEFQFIEPSGITDKIRTIYSYARSNKGKALYIDVPPDQLNIDVMFDLTCSDLQVANSAYSGYVSMLKVFHTLQSKGLALKAGNTFPLQSSGTCALSCLRTWLRSSLPELTGLKLELSLMEQSVAFLTQHKTSASAQSMRERHGFGYLSGASLLQKIIEESAEQRQQLAVQIQSTAKASRSKTAKSGASASSGSHSVVGAARKGMRWLNRKAQGKSSGKSVAYKKQKPLVNSALY